MLAADTHRFFPRWAAERILDRRPLCSAADERAQFPRVGRRGKKLERSTRVCRLRRPCTSDRSGQCQRCRSPPPPSKSSPHRPAPRVIAARAIGELGAKTRAESAWRVARSWQFQSRRIPQELWRNFARNFPSLLYYPLSPKNWNFHSPSIG